MNKEHDIELSKRVLEAIEHEFPNNDENKKTCLRVISIPHKNNSADATSFAKNIIESVYNPTNNKGKTFEDEFPLSSTDRKFLNALKSSD